MKQIFKYIFSLFLFFSFTSAVASESNWSLGEESQVRLISQKTHNDFKSEVLLGLEYKLQNGWKTYWLSPGEGGFPQEVSLTNSTNIHSFEVYWPTPEQFEILDIKSLGYKDSVIFPLKINLLDSSKSTSIIMDVNYLVCKDICIPGKAHLELTIHPGIGNYTKHSHNIEKAFSKLPNNSLELSFLDEVSTFVYEDDKQVSIELSVIANKNLKDPFVFLHTKYGLPVVNPEITLSTNSKKLNAKFIYDKNLITDKKVDLHFVIKDNYRSFLFNDLVNIENKKNSFNKNYIIILLIAFIGGLILNAMPCVLPVLSIKILSMLQNMHDKTAVRKSFIVTSLGIILSFSLLAITFIFLRHVGYNIGWGMQFQQPFFLMFIGLILIFFSMNLFGIFEISLPKFVNLHRLSSSYYARDFFNGFFATLMATPCSAPFVGTALTAAFTQSSSMMFLIFLSMSIGMSSPYLLVSLFPSFLNFFPKPGKWMIYLKYVLGILLVFTLIWITNILLNHFNYYFILFSLSLLLVTSIIIHFSKFKKIICLISIIIFFSFSNFVFFKTNYSVPESDWKDFNLTNIDKLIEVDKIVFVDITADWCVTCQYNKINVLNSKIIEEAFNKFNVIKVKGDWTKPDKNIQKFLEKNKRYGIPFNIIYSKKYPEGIILSELLSENEIINSLNRL